MTTAAKTLAFSLLLRYWAEIRPSTPPSFLLSVPPWERQFSPIS